MAAREVWPTTRISKRVADSHGRRIEATNGKWHQDIGPIGRSWSVYYVRLKGQDRRSNQSSILCQDLLPEPTELTTLKPSRHQQERLVCDSIWRSPLAIVYICTRWMSKGHFSRPLSRRSQYSWRFTYHLYPKSGWRPECPAPTPTQSHRGFSFNDRHAEGFLNWCGRVFDVHTFI